MTNDYGLSFFWYTSTPNHVPTLNGRFELIDTSTKFRDGGEIRIGLEFATGKDKF